MQKKSPNETATLALDLAFYWLRFWDWKYSFSKWKLLKHTYRNKPWAREERAWSRALTYCRDWLKCSLRLHFCSLTDFVRWEISPIYLFPSNLFLISLIEIGTFRVPRESIYLLRTFSHSMLQPQVTKVWQHFFWYDKEHMRGSTCNCIHICNTVPHKIIFCF